MGLINLASGNSLWRGYEYYKEHRVENFVRLSDHEMQGIISGSGKNTYRTTINLEHPRKSTCSCPFAEGRKVVCKHMVALYLTAFPEEASELEEERARELEEEERQDKLEQALFDYVDNMEKEELQQALLDLLLDGPDWQFERFLEEYMGESFY